MDSHNRAAKESKANSRKSIRELMIEDSDDESTQTVSNVADECALYEKLLRAHTTKVDPVEFWQLHRKEMPTLTILVRKLYGITASAAVCERGNKPAYKSKNLTIIV